MVSERIYIVKCKAASFVFFAITLLAVGAIVPGVDTDMDPVEVVKFIFYYFHICIKVVNVGSDTLGNPNFKKVLLN